MKNHQLMTFFVVQLVALVDFLGWACWSAQLVMAGLMLSPWEIICIP